MSSAGWGGRSLDYEIEDLQFRRYKRRPHPDEWDSPVEREVMPSLSWVLPATVEGDDTSSGLCVRKRV